MLKRFIKIGQIKSRLHRKIFFMMLVIGVVPIILAGIFSLLSVTSSHRDSVTTIEENLVNQKIEEIKAMLKDSVDTLSLRVGLENIDRDFRDNLSNQTFLLTSILDSKPAIKEASFIELSELEKYEYGIETVRIIRNSNEPGDFTLITNDETNDRQFLRDQSNLEKFKVAQEMGQYIGPVYFTEDGPMMTISALVKAGDTETRISVLSAELSLSDLSSITLRSNLGASGYIYITDQAGRIIAPTPGDREENDEFVKNILANKEETGTTGRYKNYDDITVASYGKYIANIDSAQPEASSLGWTIVAEWPVTDAEVIITNLKIQILVFSLIVLIAVVILSVILARKIVNPIKKLEEGTKKIAKGKFDEPVDIKTGDEIEELGIAFNKMTEGLKQLQDLKDEFVFIAAHELKTPVAAIKGYLSIINDGLAGPVSDKVKGFINKVLNANTRLIRLVEDLLEVARADAGKINIEVKPIEIPKVVEETISELQPLADEKGIEIKYEKKEIPQVLADSGRVREILVNLMGNSIKYTLDNGAIEISHEEKDGMLITHVKDHGLGMSKEAQKKLFTKFYRVATKDTAKISGTGLGLFIVKQMIEKMNGSIWAESVEGEGSTFSFSLPIAGDNK